jgi:carboxyl-terminal processing protease
LTETLFFEILYLTMQTFLKKFGASILAVAIIATTFGGGIYIGSQRANATQIPASVQNSSLGKPTDVDFSLFWKAWDILNQKFVQTHKKGTTTDQARVYGAIQGLASAFGDPYTTFFPPSEAKSFQSQISGNFEGVGMEVGIKDNVITVIAPLKNSPAARAGIKTGDYILKINGTSTQDMSVEQAVQFIRGKKGTTVTLSVLTPSAKEAHEVNIVRDTINTPTIDSELRSDGVFVIRLYTFTENSAQLFRNEIQKFVKSGSSKLVLDLRGNPGGYLEAAVDMASWFLPSDAIIVKEDTAGHGQDTVYKSRGYNIFNHNLKMVILVDGGSASASEILAGALQEHRIAKLVGTQTFGKGSVQEIVPLTDDTFIKVTMAYLSLRKA